MADYGVELSAFRMNAFLRINNLLEPALRGFRHCELTALAGISSPAPGSNILGESAYAEVAPPLHQSWKGYSREAGHFRQWNDSWIESVGRGGIRLRGFR